MKLDKQSLTKIKNYFAKKPEVTAVYLYGSFARGTENKLSDLDLGIVSKRVKDPLDFRLKCINDLTALLNFEDVDVQNLSLNGSLILNFKALKDGELIYEKDRRERVDFETKALNLYFDFAPLVNQYYKSMQERLNEGNYAS